MRTTPGERIIFRLILHLESALYLVSARPLFISIVREAIRKLPEKFSSAPLIKVAGKVEEMHPYHSPMRRMIPRPDIRVVNSSEDLSPSERPTGDLNHEYVVLDLLSPGEIDRMERFASVWHHHRPWSQIIFVAPWDEDRPEDDRLMAEMVRYLYNGLPGHVLAGFKILSDPAAWRTFLTHPVWVHVAVRIMNEVAHVLERSGRDAAARNAVLTLIANAAVVPTVSEFSRLSGTSRRQLERQLSSAGQRPPKELLASFRVLWAVVLRRDWWPPWAVASFMGLPNTTVAAQRLGSPLGLSMREIKALASINAVRWWPELFIATRPQGSDAPADPLPPLADAVQILKGRIAPLTTRSRQPLATAP